MRTSAKKRHLPGWCPAKFLNLQYLAEPTAATLKGCEYALQQNLGKATKRQTPKLSRECFGLKFMLCFLILFQFLWLKNLKYEQSSGLENLKSDIVRAQNRRFSTNFSWIQGRILGSRPKIQDFQTWISNTIWIQVFSPGSKKSFLKILDLGFVGPGIRSLTAVQTWDPKSDSCSDLKTLVWSPTCFL